MAQSRMKTRVTAAARNAKPTGTQPASTSDGDVARRAYEIYLARGREHGHDIDDWLQAERELVTKASS
jgi:hypothetical protein